MQTDFDDSVVGTDEKIEFLHSGCNVTADKIKKAGY